VPFGELFDLVVIHPRSVSVGAGGSEPSAALPDIELSR
jgi:hypothetical protein